MSETEVSDFNSESDQVELSGGGLVEDSGQSAGVTDANCRLHLLVRNGEQLDAAIDCKPHSITLDYLELYGLRPAVEQIKKAKIECRVASPRILKPAEQKVIRFLTSLDCDVLVRSAGLLHELLKLPAGDRPRLSGDFSLNVANRHSLKMLASMGLDRVTPSHDLNSQQIADLAEACQQHGRDESICVDSNGNKTGGHKTMLEVIAFQHMPVFHTEHCVFCRFLSDGTDNTNCGHPCEQHRITLRSHDGQQHPVIADVGCRNTVFEGRAQVGAAFMDQWRQQGVRDFRIEFVHQTAAQVRSIYGVFNDYVDGQIKSKQLHDRLDQLTVGKMTVGSLFVPKNFGRLYQLS